MSRGGGVSGTGYGILRLHVVWRASHVYSKGIFVSRSGARWVLRPWALVLGEVSRVFCRRGYLEFDYSLCTFELRSSVRNCALYSGSAAAYLCESSA